MDESDIFSPPVPPHHLLPLPLPPAPVRRDDALRTLPQLAVQPVGYGTASSVAEELARLRAELIILRRRAPSRENQNETHAYC